MFRLTSLLGGGSFLPWVSPPQRCPGVVPGCAAPRVSSAQARPGVAGCGYHIDQARGLARGGNTLYPKFPVPEIGYRLERSGTPFRTEPFRCLEDKLSLSYYKSDGMDSKTKSQSHTPSRIKYTAPVSPRAIYPGYTPGIPRVSQRGGRPGVRRTPGITTAELVPRCVDHIDARGIPGVGTTPPVPLSREPTKYQVNPCQWNFNVTM